MSNANAGAIRFALTFDEWCDAAGISRSRGYKKLREGEIETFMEGRRRMVSIKAAQRYVERKEKEAREGRAAA